MEKQEKLEECVTYFKSRTVYRRLFKKFRDKYAGLGYFGGTVKLTGLTREEKEQLGGFLQKDYTENKSLSVSASLMEKALKTSRFSEISWDEILTAYFGESLVTKKEEKFREELEKEGFFSRFLSSCSFAEGKNWLESVLKERGEGYYLLMQQYREDPQELWKILERVMAAVQRLADLRQKGRKELLAVFAADVTGDPHYFDEGTAGEKLLSAYVKNRVNMESSEGLSAIEYKKKMLYEAGIIKDELSNDVLVYGIQAERRDGSVHPGIEGFFQCREPIKLTMETLGKIEKIRPGKASLDSKQSRVYVVENPAVFSVLIQRYPDRTFVCGNGQIRLAVLVLLDKLTENSILYYAGDFDPEGLLIAQKLKNRYKERMEFWHYDKSLYEKNLSEVYLSDRRIKKLEKVQDPGLQEIRDEMRRVRRAAYQEKMLGDWFADWQTDY